MPVEALVGLGAIGTPAAPQAVRDAADAPQNEQNQWFMREVLPHAAGLRPWLLRHHPGLKDDLDDIVQEAYLRLLRARAAGPIRCARTYLFGIARYVALELHRKRRKLSETSVNELPESDTIAVDADTIAMITHSQDLALTAEAISHLPDRCRQIVTLHTTEQLSYQQIAARLGLAEETVRVQMARAVKKCVSFLRGRDQFGMGGL